MPDGLLIILALVYFVIGFVATMALTESLVRPNKKLTTLGWIIVILFLPAVLVSMIVFFLIILAVSAPDILEKVLLKDNKY